MGMDAYYVPQADAQSRNEDAMKSIGFTLRALRYWILGGRNPRPEDGSCFYCSAVPVDRWGVCQRCREGY